METEIGFGSIDSNLFTTKTTLSKSSYEKWLSKQKESQKRIKSVCSKYNLSIGEHFRRSQLYYFEDLQMFNCENHKAGSTALNKHFRQLLGDDHFPWPLHFHSVSDSDIKYILSQPQRQHNTTSTQKLTWKGQKPWVIFPIYPPPIKSLQVS